MVDAVGHVMQGAALGQPEGDSEHPGVGAVGDVHQACLAEDLGPTPSSSKRWKT